MMIEMAGFGIAFTLINPSSVLPAFARRLTDVPVLIGLANTLWTAGWTFPQLLWANTVGRDPRNRRTMRIGVCGRLLLWLIPLGLALGLAQRPMWMLALTLVAVTGRATLDGLTAISWSDFMAREIPANRRGRLQAGGQLIGGLASIGVGALLSLILARYEFPQSYTLVFVLGAAAFLPGSVAVWLLREHVPEGAAAERSTHMSAGGWFRPLFDDAGFRRLLACRVLYGLMMLASSYYVIHAADVLLLPEHVIGQFAIVQTVSKLLFGTLLGLICDRRGPRTVIRVGVLVTALGPAFALLTHTLAIPWLGRLYPLVFVSAGISQATFVIGFANYLIEMAPERVRPAYIGLGNTFGGISSIWPLLGGWLLTTTSYTVLFSVTAALLLVAFFASLRLRPAVRCRTEAEERAVPGRVD
jgi:MFS family permease